MKSKNRKCHTCGREIIKRTDARSVNVFCSKECFSSYRKVMNCKVWPIKPCLICSIPVTRCPSQMLENACCSTECTKIYASERLSKLNRELNPSRMTPKTKEKLRYSKLGKGEGKSYTKIYGRHTHRVVAEEKLGRPLLPGEVVHHIDENKRNNHPDNLMVFKSQAEHAKHHTDLRFKKNGI